MKNEKITEEELREKIKEIERKELEVLKTINFPTNPLLRGNVPE